MEDTQGFKIGCGVAAFVGAIIFVFMFVFGSFAQIDAGHVGVLTTWGKVEPNVLQPGFNFKTPFAQAVYDYDVRVQAEKVKAAAATRDLQDASTEVTLNYNPDPAHIFDLHNTIGPDFKARVVDPNIQEVIKASTAQYTASELITKREEVRLLIRNTLTERLKPFYIVVREVNITNFDFSKAFNDAIDAANVARQQVITAQNTLDRQKVEAQLQITQAEAQATAKKAQADADAYVTLTNAKAQAEAYRLQVAAFGDSATYVQYVQASRWNGAVPSTVLGSGSNFLFNLK